MKTKIKSQFSLNHIAVIAGVIFVLGGLSVFQNWERVSAMLNNPEAEAEQGSGLYYTYTPPALPTVLGSDTIPDGPVVLNEDGTFSSLEDIGDVLGANSDSPSVDLNSIQIKTIPGNPENLRVYIDQTFLIESAILPGDFETAIASGDPSKTHEQVDKLKQVHNSLQNMNVPDMAEKLHRAKIAQYATAIELLQNFYQLDTNAGFVSSKLQQFMEMQKLQDEENQKFFKQYPQL